MLEILWATSSQKCLQHKARRPPLHTTSKAFTTLFVSLPAEHFCAGCWACTHPEIAPRGAYLQNLWEASAIHSRKSGLRLSAVADFVSLFRALEKRLPTGLYDWEMGRFGRCKEKILQVQSAPSFQPCVYECMDTFWSDKAFNWYILSDLDRPAKKF